jgi:hypothetical protein
MIKARQKYPTDLYGTTRMGPRCSSAETQVCHRSYIIAAILDPASKGHIVGMIRQMTTAFGILSM